MFIQYVFSDKLPKTDSFVIRKYPKYSAEQLSSCHIFIYVVSCLAFIKFFTSVGNKHFLFCISLS